MTKITVYEKNEFLYENWNFSEGDLVQLYYLPTERSRKWRKSSLSMRWCEKCVDVAKTLLKQEGWYSYKFEKL